MLRVKLCGMTSPSDVALCAGAGAHALGFVTEYPADVPWNLTAAEARDLVRAAPPFVTTCMVAGGSPEEILRLADIVQPHVVQLHGDETLAEIEVITAALAKRGVGTLKALRVSPEGTLRFEVSDPAAAAESLTKTGIRGIIVDAYTPQRPGGSGVVADTAVYRAVRGHTSLPVILAGGLRADNLADVVPRDLPPYGVDVLSGVEASPRQKDPTKVAALLRAAAAIT